MKIIHLDSNPKPTQIDVYNLKLTGKIMLDYTVDEFVIINTYKIGKWNIKYKTND